MDTYTNILNMSNDMQCHSIGKNTVHLYKVGTFANQLLLKHKLWNSVLMRQVGALLGNHKWPTVKLMNYMPLCHNL